MSENSGNIEFEVIHVTPELWGRAIEVAQSAGFSVWDPSRLAEVHGTELAGAIRRGLEMLDTIPAGERDTLDSLADFLNADGTAEIIGGELISEDVLMPSVRELSDGDRLCFSE